MTVKDICKRLVRVKSFSGRENKVAEEIKNIMSECCFDEIETDSYGNVMGTIKGNKDGATILFDAHIDTVAVSDEDQWTNPPFSANEENGRIYGRGTSDMKGALSAMLYAGSVLAKNRDFSGKYIVAGVVHEECFEGVAARGISEKYSPDYVVIGEATELELALGQRGRTEVVVETFGLCAHSSNPQKGINAVLSMLSLCGEIDKLAPPTHPQLGSGILALTDIRSEPYPGASVIPNYCRATYDRRTLEGETKEDVLLPIEKIISNLSQHNPNFNAKVSIAVGNETCYTGEKITGQRFFPAWVTDLESNYSKKAIDALKKAGITPRIRYYSFCTNGSHYAGEKGIKTIGFGPSMESLAHVKDEYVEISQLEKAAKGYEEIALALLS